MQYLDWCHEAGVKVLYDISQLGFSAGEKPPMNYSRDWDTEAWVAAVRGNVSLVAAHPAILAFYICVSNLLSVYQILLPPHAFSSQL